MDVEAVLTVWYVLSFILFVSHQIIYHLHVMCCILITKSQNTPIECTHYLFSIFMGIRMFIVSSGVLRVYEQHCGYRIGSRNCIPSGATGFTPGFIVGLCCSSYLFSVWYMYCALLSCLSSFCVVCAQRCQCLLIVHS